MCRRAVLFLLLWHSLFPVLAACAPSFLWIIADDLGWADVGYNGGPVRTPFLDAMAAAPGTVRFNRFYAGAPLCSPSRSALLTGRFGARDCIYGVNGPSGVLGGPAAEDFASPPRYPLPWNVPTVAHLLRQHNYSTGLFGKWHLGDLLPSPHAVEPRWSVSSPTQAGFEHWVVTLGSGLTLHPNCGCFKENDSVPYCNYGWYNSTTSPFGCQNYWYCSVNNNATNPANSSCPGRWQLQQVPYVIRGDDSAYIIEHAEEAIRLAHAEAKPFFIVVMLHAPHAAFVASSADLSQVNASAPENVTLNSQKLHYYGSIVAMDRQVGHLRSLLRELHIENDTMLLFSSDNGPCCGAVPFPGNALPLRSGKGSLYEGGIRVPGLVEWPSRITRNCSVSTPVGLVDMLPTVLDALNITYPNTQWALDGESILPFLSCNASSARKSPLAFIFSSELVASYLLANPALANASYPQFALIDGNWKLIANASTCEGTCSPRLYNLATSVNESFDVSAAYPVRYQQMLHRWTQWVADVRRSQLYESFCHGNDDPARLHCNNSVQDDDELGVDCGGSCPRCVPPSTALPVLSLSPSTPLATSPHPSAAIVELDSPDLRTTLVIVVTATASSAILLGLQLYCYRQSHIGKRPNEGYQEGAATEL